MRKITQEITKAFYNNESKEITNTRTDGLAIYLHDNKIAEKRYHGKKDFDLWITLSGLNTNTTRERLKGLNNVKVTTKQGQAYLNGEKWNGEWIKIA